MTGAPSLRLAFAASDRPEAQDAKARLIQRYGDVAEDAADVVVVLGGDGFMLETLHRNLAARRPIYGMNRGSVGFLMNDYGEEGLIERIAAAEQAIIHPLSMTAIDVAGAEHRGLAINDVSLLRETRQTAKLRILVDGRLRLDELICDGALVSTPAGSTAYNLSAHGPIIPIDGQVMALTPISAFRPRPLARRPALPSRPGDIRGAGGRQTPGQRRRRQCRSPRRPAGRCGGGSQHRAGGPVRRRPQPG